VLHLVVLAAASTIKDTPSKIPFYVCGGLLVIFALVMSAIGIRGETFPPSRGARLGVIALGVVLVAAAMTTAVATA
jgi:drug/metabolite transporter (DMT)-like permease